MALKIIKKDDQAAQRIQQYFFSGDPRRSGAVAGESEQWAPSAAPHEAPRAKSSAVDVAQLEKKAFQQGFGEGEKAAAAEAENKLGALMQRYAESISEIDSVKTSLYTRVERDVVKLALEVAKKIVHREVQADPEIVQTLVKVALGHAAGKAGVKVRLHPSDYSTMLEHRAGLTSANPEGREIELLSDTSIDRGGCLVQTDCGDIDARIEEEFREVERSFFANQD
jgi:flagellar assembly protein FliH